MFRLIALYIPHTLLVVEGKVIIQAQIRGECEPTSYPGSSYLRGGCEDPGYEVECELVIMH